MTLPSEFILYSGILSFSLISSLFLSISVLITTIKRIVEEMDKSKEHPTIKKHILTV